MLTKRYRFLPAALLGVMTLFLTGCGTNLFDYARNPWGIGCCGLIILILDINALVRTGAPIVELKSAAPAPTDDRPLAMVVDDSITVRRVMERFLERNGMRVVTAKDGLDGISVLRDHRPDIILLDIEMPRMDGYEFATHVRNDERISDVPIIMITSRVGDKHRARAIEIGVNDYLGKPYQEVQLLEAIARLLEERGLKFA